MIHEITNRIDEFCKYCKLKMIHDNRDNTIMYDDKIT